MFEADITFSEPVSATVSLISDNEDAFREEVIKRLQGVSNLEFILITNLGEVPESMLIEELDSKKVTLN